jgi:hypothetical protein
MSSVVELKTPEVDLSDIKIINDIKEKIIRYSSEILDSKEYEEMFSKIARLGKGDSVPDIYVAGCNMLNTCDPDPDRDLIEFYNFFENRENNITHTRIGNSIRNMVSIVRDLHEK